MTKSISAGLEAHLAQEETTTATCWKVTLRDGAILGFTDHAADLIVSNVTYLAATGYTASAVQSSAAVDVDNLDLVGALDPSAINAADVRAGRWDLATIEIFRVNWRDLSQGTLAMRKGVLGQISRTKIGFQAELRGQMQFLTQSIGRLHMPSCDADLGDARCGINLATFTRGTVTGSLNGVTSRILVSDSTLPDADGWFTGGKLTMTSGLSLNYSREIKQYTAFGGVISLQEAMPFAIAVGDTYSMTAGCLKRFTEDCKNKFNNVVNFRGFPHLPGMDRLLTGKAS